MRPSPRPMLGLALRLGLRQRHARLHQSPRWPNPEIARLSPSRSRSHSHRRSLSQSSSTHLSSTRLPTLQRQPTESASLWPR